MKRFLIISIVFFFGFVTIQNENNVDSREIEIANKAFSELKEILEKEKGQLWNYSLLGPVMLVNRETRILYANEPDSKGEFKKYGNVYIAKLPENITIANTAIDWNNKRWTMVAFPLPVKIEEQLNLLIHESFHRIQPLIGFDSLYEIQNIHLDTKEARIYLKLELEALKKALNSENPNMHIKNALLFRQYRYQLFPEAKFNENSLELNEGLAEYTGSILSQRTDDKLRNHYISEIDWFYNMPTFVRSFAYFTIPEYGYFMRKKDPKWNLKITKNTNLTDFIFAFYGISKQNLYYEKIKQIGKEYDIDLIIKYETEREVKRKEQVIKYKRKFLNDSVLVISLENMKIGFNPGNIIPLDSLGTVYPNIRIVDNWGILEVDSCGALMSSEWNKVTISYPEFINDSIITGQGWRLKLNKSWKLNMNNNMYYLIKE